MIGRFTQIVSRITLAAALLLLLGFAAHAQSNTGGAITGSVTDPSGAILQKASISATNIATNAKASGTTDDSGRFIISGLEPGVYTLEISAQGFGASKMQNVIVEVGRSTSIDVHMALASQTEQVVATAEAPVITTDRPDFTTNINLADVQHLPIYARRWSWLALSTPGAVPDGGFGLVSFRGVSGLLNNNTVDGADNNQYFFSEERGRTRISYSTSEASIQEFQVNTSNYSAEYGRAAGGVVNAVTKSGTNQIHGEAFWYYRNSDWGAINPFQTHLVGGLPVPFLPEDKRHQFGGSLGGWLIKDKLFWFFSADQQLRPFPAVANSGTPGAIFAPLSAPEITTLTTRGVLPSNQAAVNAALALQQNLTGTVARRGDQLVLLPKIDWTINQKNHFAVSYNRLRWNSPEGIQTAAVVNRGIESFGNDFVKDDWGIARLDTTVSNTMTNELRYQYGRDFEFENGQASITGEPVSSLGFSPQVSISGVGGWVFGMPNFLQRPKYPDERRNQIADTYSWSHGSHFIKFGVDYNHVHDTEINLFEGFGAYSYATRVDWISDFVAATTATGPFCPGGCYSSYAQGFGTPGFSYSTNDIGLFVQDDWRIKPRLTINLGLRWDAELLPSPQLPNSAIAGTTKFPSDLRDFGPRLGAAWDIFGNGKTILRGGYGIYYGRIINSTIFNAIADTGLPAGQNTVSLSQNQGGPLYPNVITSGSAPAGLNIIQFAPDTRLPMVHEFDLQVERQIATNTVVSISYIGSLGRRLPRFVDTNLAAPTLTTTYTVAGGPLNGQTFTVPFFGVPCANPCPTTPVPVTGTGRPNTSVAAVTDVSDAVQSNYNAMVVDFTRRMYKSFQIQSDYTWSRANDFGQSSQTFTATNNVLNPFNLGAEYSRSNFDIRDRFTFAGIWAPDYYHGDSRWVRELANGFTVSPVIAIASGAPFTPTISGNAPSQLGNGTPISTCKGQVVLCYIAVTGGTGVLADGGTNRPPFLGPNSFQMPRTAEVDLRVERSFTFYERWKLVLSGDAFNLLNHVNVTGVNTQMFTTQTSVTAGCPSGSCLNFLSTFGAPTASSNTLLSSRQIQLGAKLSF